MNKPLFRVIVAGSRNFNDYKLLCSILDKLLANKALTHSIVIVSGKAKGADTLGERYAKERGYQIMEFPADWNTYGKSAGYRRNVDMANNADALIAFRINNSVGTTHMINIAKDKGLLVRAIDVTGISAIFKNRGHFCNYCRKIVYNKVKDTDYQGVISINESIWEVWNTGNECTMESFVKDLESLEVKPKCKMFNDQLRVIINKYGKGEKRDV